MVKSCFRTRSRLQFGWSRILTPVGHALTSVCGCHPLTTSLLRLTILALCSVLWSSGPEPGTPAAGSCWLLPCLQHPNGCHNHVRLAGHLKKGWNFLKRMPFVQRLSLWAGGGGGGGITCTERTTRFRGGFRGSSLGSLEPPFLKLATYQQTLTELADTLLSSGQLCSHVRLQECVPRTLKWVRF